MPLEVPATLLLLRFSRQWRRLSPPHLPPSDLVFSFVFVVLIVASLPSDQGVFGSGSDLAVFGACGVLQRIAFQAAGWFGRGVGNVGVCVFELDLGSGELLGSAAAGVDECVYRAVLDSVG